jgi:hypothetical protein
MRRRRNGTAGGLFTGLLIAGAAAGGYYWWKKSQEDEDERQVPRPPLPDPTDPQKPTKDKTPPLIRLAVPRSTDPQRWTVVKTPAGVSVSEGGDVVDFTSSGPVDVLVSLPDSTHDYWMTIDTETMTQLSEPGDLDVLYRFTGNGRLDIHVNEGDPSDWGEFIVNVRIG